MPSRDQRERLPRGSNWLVRHGWRRQMNRMRQDWDRRARENAFHFIADGQVHWSEGDFHESGRLTVQGDILSDMENICQGRDPKRMSILEIGCGAGRVTHALAQVFGEVHAVDVSGEMIRLASQALHGAPNVFLYRNSGVDLAVLGERRFDFAYATAVFHHIGSREIIENYIREVNRLLNPGCLFKFEVQGSANVAENADETWLGPAFNSRQMVEMAVRCNFDPRYREGEGQERFWWWFFKWPEE